MNTTQHKSLEKKEKYVTIADIAIFVVVLSLVLLLFIASLVQKEGTNRVEITSEEGVFLFILEEERELVLQGPLGDTNVQITQNTVDVIDSPGRQKICVNARPISQPGEWLACLPNKIFIRIIGIKQENSASVDGISF